MIHFEDEVRDHLRSVLANAERAVEANGGTAEGRWMAATLLAEGGDR